MGDKERMHFELFNPARGLLVFAPSELLQSPYPIQLSGSRVELNPFGKFDMLELSHRLLGTHTPE